MTQAYTFVSLNINKITSALKLASLREFIYDSGADIVFLQEVRILNLSVTGFRTIANVAPEAGTGTAILLREGIPANDIELLESGRGISCRIYDVTLINLYAPSGSSNKAERSLFFKEEIIYLLRRCPVNVLMGGDFNCVLHAKDQFPHFNYCKELHELVRNLQLKDSWEHKFPTQVKFTFFTSTSSSRLDRIYVSNGISERILSVDVIPAYFSDHCAFSLTINLDKQPAKRFRSPWMLNTSHLTDSDIDDVVTSTWNMCLRSITNYASKAEWWTRVAKRKLRQTLISYGIRRAWGTKKTFDFYYTVLRELYEKSGAAGTNITEIKRVKAKLLSLKRQQMEGLKVKCKPKSVTEDEMTSLYHLMRHVSRRRRTFIDILETDHGDVLTDQRNIVHEIHQHFEKMYSSESTDDVSLDNMIRVFNSEVTQDENAEVLLEFSRDEVFDFILNSPSHKSPGPDGLPKEFYVKFWNVIGGTFTDIVNEILMGGPVPADFKEGRIVLVPKKTGHKTIATLRPITLMNFDYKTIARALNNRLTPILRKVVKPHQTCLPGRSIMSSIAEYRDVVAVAAVTNIKCAMLFLDFCKAFDRVSHRYLMRILQQIGLEARVVSVICNMITGITAPITINGQLTKPIRIDRGVPQGSPLSMSLFVLSLEPLLRRLNEDLSGLTIFGGNLTARAYADDVVVLLRRESDVGTIKNGIDIYCRASGAKLSEGKCKLLDIRGFETVSVSWATMVDNHTTLGIIIDRCPLKMAAQNWRRTINIVQGAIRANKWRSTNLIEKIRILDTYILSKAYYIAQVFPIPKMQARKIMQLQSRYVWENRIFRLNHSITTKSRQVGGLELTDISRKATALYIKRTIVTTNNEPQTVTSKLFRVVRPASMQPPIDIRKLNYKLKHISEFYLETSYLGTNILRKTALQTKLLLAEWRKTDTPNPVELKYNNVTWSIVWKNISLKIHSSEVLSSWYTVINNVVPTNEKLNRIGLSDTPNCIKCGLIDTLKHRFTCSGHLLNWKWVRKRLAFLTRSSENNFTTDILLWPDTAFYPQTKNNTVMWLLGHYVNYIINHKGDDNTIDFQDYMVTAYWHRKQIPNMKRDFGNMLKIIFEETRLA